MKHKKRCCECGAKHGLVQWAGGRCPSYVCQTCAWLLDYPFYLNQTEFP